MEFVIKYVRNIQVLDICKNVEGNYNRKNFALKLHIGCYKYSLVLEHWRITAITTICKWRLEASF